MKKAILIILSLLIAAGAFALIAYTQADAMPLQQSGETITPATPQPPAATSPLQATSTPAAQTYARPVLNLTGYTYDASKAYAGGSFTLSTVFSNVGQSTAYNITITYSGNGFQTKSNGGVGFIGSLGAGSNLPNSQDFFILGSIASTPAAITVQADYKDEKGTPYTQTFQVSINVWWYDVNSTSTPTPTITPTALGQPNLVVKSYAIDVPTLEPGSSFNLTLNIENQGVYTAGGVSLSIGGGGGSSSGTTSTSSNFLPVGSSNYHILGDIGVQQAVTFQQAFIVNSSTTPGAYPVTLDFTYTDSKGASVTAEQIITLLVYQVPYVEASFYQDPGTFTVGTKGNLPLQVVNLTSSSILLGDITITADSATLANSTAFIGNVGGGSSFTMDVDFTPKTSGSLPITVTITYLDNFNNARKITQTLTVTVNGGQASNFATTPNATRQATQGTTSNQTFPNGFQTVPANDSETFWQVAWRFVKGLIGLDSSRTASTAIPGNFRQFTSGTQQPFTRTQAPTP